MAASLSALVEAVRAHPGVAAKADIGVVADVFGNADWLSGPGDDGAVVQDEERSLVVGGRPFFPRSSRPTRSTRESPR